MLSVGKRSRWFSPHSVTDVPLARDVGVTWTALPIKDANDTARGVGAMIGAALVVAGRAALPVAPVLAKSAVKEVQQEIKGERKQRNAPPGPDARAEGNPHSRIEREGADGQYTTHNGDGTFKQYRGSGEDTWTGAQAEC